MKFIAVIFTALTLTFGVWLFIAPDFDPEDAEVVVPTYQDMLPYLVKNSDLVAVIKISDVNEVFGTYDSPAVASVISVFLEKDKMNPAPNQIKIIPVPAIQHEGSIHTVMILSNGETLAFLHKAQSGDYKPTTANSLSSVFNSGNVYPIWKQSNKLGEMSPGFPLEEVKREILAIAKTP